MVNFGVHYLGDFIFWFSIDEYRYWRRFRMLLEGIGNGWFEHRDMEHRVNGLYGIWKAECEGLWTGLSNYFIWSKVLFGEFFQ